MHAQMRGNSSVRTRLKIADRCNKVTGVKRRDSRIVHGRACGQMSVLHRRFYRITDTGRKSAVSVGAAAHSVMIPPLIN